MIYSAPRSPAPAPAAAMAYNQSLSAPLATVVIPTLQADQALADCLASLERQTRSDFEVIVVDNSGRGLVRSGPAGRFGARIVENSRNVGFGEAVNQGVRASTAPFIVTLNDDAVASPGWIDALVRTAQAYPRAGMVASRVLLAGAGAIDSAGMLLCADGSSKQRGHGEPAARYAEPEEALLPSASAALYRREMLEEIGLFDGAFFLYVEDTDVGLRGRWLGWTCRYAPDAVVEHRYSHSSGRASRLKAYFVERNRLFLVAKTFPARMFWRVPLASLARYWWHAAAAAGGRGAAAEFRRSGNSALWLAAVVVRAHAALLWNLPRLRRQRRALRRKARISAADFRRLAAAYSISPRQGAEL